jgi:polysaccharide export outer membrane protein
MRKTLQNACSTSATPPHAAPLGARALVASLALAVALAGCTFASSDVKQVQVEPDIIRSSVRFQKEYLLAVGDQVEVSVWRTPEVSRTVAIRPDGYLSLPLIQEVKAAGLTPKELAASIHALLAKRFLDPEVTVIPVNVRQPTIYVLGDVKAPGAFPLRNAMTASQALALAGGTLRSGDDNTVTLIRLSGDGYLEAIPIKSHSILSQPGPYLALAATRLEADDIVFVPETGRSQVMRLLSDVLVPVQIYLDYKLIESVL